MVQVARFELARITPLEPKSNVAANYTTPAGTDSEIWTHTPYDKGTWSPRVFQFRHICLSSFNPRKKARHFIVASLHIGATIAAPQKCHFLETQ